MTLVLLTGACTDPLNAAPGADPGSSAATGEEPGPRLVVLGDSIASPTTCSGCVTFPDQVATELGTALGTGVEVVNLSWDVTNPKPAEVADILEYLRSDQAARAAVAGADAILINASQNDLAYNRRDDPCGVAPDYPSVSWEDLTHACIDDSLDDYRRNLDALLDEVDTLRAQRQTMLRIVTGYNSAIGDLVAPTWNSDAAIVPTTYNVSRMVDLPCDLATQHGGKCADAYHALNGPDGQQEGQQYLDDYDAVHLTQGGHDQIAATIVALGFEPLLPDPAQPESATALELPMVDRVPVTPRHTGDLTYVADGSIVRREPGGTATTWVSRSVLGDACGRPDCDIRDLEWSPNGVQLAVVLGTIRRTSPSQLGVYVIGDDPRSPRKVFECLPAMCDTLQGLAISWSPDSSKLAVAGDQVGEGLVVVDLNHPVADPRTLCNDCPAAAPAWSPDGRWIAYISRGTVRRIFAEGGPSELVTKGPAQSVAWSPDGARLLIGDVDAVQVLDLSRRPYSATTIGEPLRPGEGPAAPAWSPDGKRVSWFSTPRLNEGFKAEVWTANSDGSDPQRLSQSGCCVGDWTPPAWSPDGDLIVLGLGLDATRPPDLILLESSDGTEVERTAGVGWGPMSWQALP